MMMWKISLEFQNITPSKIKMSRTTNKFSLFDFCKKQAGKMEIYGEVTLDEDGNIIPFIEQAALITQIKMI